MPHADCEWWDRDDRNARLVSGDTDLPASADAEDGETCPAERRSAYAR
jgi:hypothetical protein